MSKPLQRRNYEITALHVPHQRTRSAALHSVSTAAALRPSRVAVQLCCLSRLYNANALCRMCIVLMSCDVNQHGLWRELFRASLPLANAAQVPQQTASALCILTSIGDRSFCSSVPRAWNFLPPSLRAGALACTNATPGTVSHLLRCYLLATHFDAFSHDSSLLPATSVLRLLRKRDDSPRGSVLAIKKSSSS